MNFFVWIILIVSGIISTLIAWLDHGPGMGVLVLFCFIGGAWAWQTLWNWFHGLRRVAKKHLKKPIHSLTFIGKEIGTSREVDYARVLESLGKKQQLKPVGVGGSWELRSLQNMDVPTSKVTWQSVEAEDGQIINVPVNAVYRLRFNNVPFLVQVHKSEYESYRDYHQESTFATGQGVSLQLCCIEGLDQANDILKWLKSQTADQSVFRRKMVTIASPRDGTSGQAIRVVQRPEQSEDQIILPATITQVVKRLIHSKILHKEQLKKYGQSSKMGLLFHGPPGTGKTLLTRRLISECPEHTVIVPTDMAVETLREAFRLGQYLQPSIMVLEDVDLLAPQRELSGRLDGLQELMNQLDGLAPSSETVVVMSTNRPEVVESALASRPGRISQAVEFPLPDGGSRQKLFQLFLADLKSSFDQEHWVARTKGASPAFIQELCNRAILLTIEASEVKSVGEQVEIKDEHLDAAIHELVGIGGTLTATALGFPSSGH